MNTRAQADFSALKPKYSDKKILKNSWKMPEKTLQLAEKISTKN